MSTPEVTVRLELVDAVRLGRWLHDGEDSEDDEWVTAMGLRILAAAQGAVHSASSALPPIGGNDGG